MAQGKYISTGINHLLMRFEGKSYTAKCGSRSGFKKGFRLCEENRKAIREFNEYLQAKVCDATRLLYLWMLYHLVSYSKKPFKQMDTKDTVGFVSYLKDRFNSAATIDRQVIKLKMFFKWLYGIDEEGVYPDIVKGSVLDPKGRSVFETVTQSDFITEDEFKSMIEVSNTRDRALLWTLMETGARKRELLSMKVKDVQFNLDGTAIITIRESKRDSKGRNKMRPVLLYNAVPALKDYINSHPYRSNPSYPLWISLNKKHIGKPLSYTGVDTAIDLIVKRSKVPEGKRIYPHLFRHTAAYCDSKWMNEMDMRLKFGWEKGSRMPEYYASLSHDDLHEKQRKHLGIKSEQSANDKLKAKACERCGIINDPTNKFCSKCWRPLDMETAFELDKKRNETIPIVESFRLLLNNPSIQEVLRADQELGRSMMTLLKPSPSDQ